MAINSYYNSGKLFKCMRENLPMLSGADLDDLKDAIMDEMKARENERVVELKEKAIQALREFFNAGGYVLNNKDNYNYGIDEALMSSGEDDHCIFLL